MFIALTEIRILYLPITSHVLFDPSWQGSYLYYWYYQRWYATLEVITVMFIKI